MPHDMVDGLLITTQHERGAIQLDIKHHQADSSTSQGALEDDIERLAGRHQLQAFSLKKVKTQHLEAGRAPSLTILQQATITQYQCNKSNPCFTGVLEISVIIVAGKRYIS